VANTVLEISTLQNIQIQYNQYVKWDLL